MIVKFREIPGNVGYELFREDLTGESQCPPLVEGG
jgi:hypothetical protein